MSKRKSVVKQMIDEALSKVDGTGFPEDPELDREVGGPERFAKGQKAKDEVIIDSQLADISTKEGYFLKLKKEMRPNEWMLMKTIESDWRTWPDIETAVANIVKEHTKTAPSKWGSGPYRIEYACKGGMRGKGYPPLDFYINAEEEFLNNVGGVASSTTIVADPTTQVTAQLDMLGRLMDVVRGMQPAPVDPAKTQEQIAGAFEKGLAAKASDGSSQAQMMTAMMTGMMSMMTAIATNKPVEPRVVNPNESLTGMLETLKTFGVLGNNQPAEKPKTLVETLAELKAIGLDIFKKDDPMEQISKLKQFAGIASDLMGMGGTSERPSILEKVVDMLGPALPGMVKEIADASKNAVQVQVEAGRNIERAKLAAPMQPQPVSHEGTTMNSSSGAVDMQSQQLQAFFNGLYESVQTNNRMYYPIIYTSLLQDPKGTELIGGVVNGSQTAKELIELLQSYGDVRFKDSEFVMKRLVGYVNGFIVWLRDMVKPKAYAEAAAEVPPSNGFVAPKGAGVDIECVKCNTVFVFDSLEEFMKEESKVCGANGCTGALQPLQKVS